jgi:glutathione S-transferase
MIMDLYFAPLACSMATRIALYEAGAQAHYIQRDRNKRLPDGSDFCDVNPLGTVPTLRTDDGEVLTENAAILQYVAAQFPQAGLAPADVMERARLHQWLSFIGTELHKAVFLPLLRKEAPADAKAYALGLAEARLTIVDKHLSDREFLLASFSVADAYLFTVLNWSTATPVKLDGFPAIQAYAARVQKRPSVAKALSEEFEIYKAEQARAKAA